MFNASAIIKNALDGNTSAQDFIRALDGLQQFSSGRLNFNFVVNSILSMGCRLIIRADGNIAAVPIDNVVEPNPPKFLRVRTHEKLTFVRNEPFEILGDHWPHVYMRIEIMMHGSSVHPTITAAYREVETLDVAMSERMRHVPPFMVALPVLCVTTGEIKLVRISLRSLRNAKLIPGAVYTVHGKGPKRFIKQATVTINHEFNVAEAVESNRAALDQLDDDYASAQNLFNVEQAITLRNVLDTRLRDAEAMQALTMGMHAPNAPAASKAPQKRA